MSISSKLHKEHSQMLFDKNLGTAKNQLELDELLKQYAIPKYDPLYVCLATRVDFEKKRQWIEAMWMEYQRAKLADKNFASDFKVQCYQRAWELYLGITLHKRWGLQPGSKSGRPDFRTIHNANKGAQTIWIEAIAVEKGDPPHRVPEMVVDGVGKLPEDEMLLRLTNGLDKKYKGYCKYVVKQDDVRINDPYIIAINRSKLEHLDPQIPLILKCLFRLGCQVLFTEPKKLDLKAIESFWTTRDYITKENGFYANLLAEEHSLSGPESERVSRSDPKEVPMGFFDNPEHSGISAVIYVNTDIINSPILPEEMGESFTIVLNPHAKNPLPEKLLTFGSIWRKEGDHIFLINAPKKHNISNSSNHPL